MSKSCKQTPSQLNHRGNYPLAKLGKGMPKFGKKYQPSKRSRLSLMVFSVREEEEQMAFAFKAQDKDSRGCAVSFLQPL